MTVGRRSFLRLFAASPLAAKAARDEVIGNLTGMAANGIAGLGHGGNPSAPYGSPSSIGDVAPDVRRSRLMDWFRRSALPDWEVERIKRDLLHVYALDPDIAALRSFSMNVKIGIQRERNIERHIEGLKGQSAYEQMREDFRAKHGFWFWW